jgi:cystathionine gamma-synthase
VDLDEAKPETWVVVAGRAESVPGAPLNTPLVAASSYVLGSERIYSRNEATEGWEAFEAMLGGLEGGHAVAFSSGMGACASVLGQRPTGAHLALLDDCYQAAAAIAEDGARTHQWRVERLSATDPAWLQRASVADLWWIESPSNPLLEVADLEGICAAPRRAGTRVVVDNTFATPLLQRALQLGADIVVHSASKLIGGHCDLLLGAASPPTPASWRGFARSAAGTEPPPGCSSASWRCAALGRWRCGCARPRARRSSWRHAYTAIPPPTGCGTRASARSSASSSKTPAADRV